MGKLRGAYITENRIYDNPADPENSEYDVSLQLTTPEAVIDPRTGKTLENMLSEAFNGSPVTETQAGVMTPELLLKLNGIEPGAKNYTHPSTHPASMIEDDPLHRFASDSFFAQVNDFMSGSNGANFGSVLDTLSRLMFQLAIKGIIDMDGMGGIDTVVVDTIDSADAVSLISGVFADKRIYI